MIETERDILQSLKAGYVLAYDKNKGKVLSISAPIFGQLILKYVNSDLTLVETVKTEKVK